MKTEEKCPNCGEKTVHKEMGMLPVMFTQSEEKHKWEKSAMCLSCGSVTPRKVTEEELRDAHERVLKEYVRHGFLTEEQMKKELS